MNIRLSRVPSLVCAALVILSTATANSQEGLVKAEFRAKLGQPMQEPASSSLVGGQLLDAAGHQPRRSGAAGCSRSSAKSARRAASV